MSHSGDCIHSPIWDGHWDNLVLTPEVTQISDGSKAYKLNPGESTSYHDAWACDTCTSFPGYFNDYLLYKLNELKNIEEVIL